MYARSTTIHGQPTMIDAGIKHVRDVVMPQVRELPGCAGISLLADRSSGRCIVTTAWESEQALRASAEVVGPIRARAAEEFGGEVSVDEWEVAYLHRNHHAAAGACARVTWTEGDPAAVDRVVDVFRASIMPRVEKLEGFCSASLFVDRAAGRSCVTATYDSTEAMTKAADTAMGLRADLVQETGMRVVEVAEFELALAHLDVPELV
ncbi:antibiotic biosynthesis monooxygenase [Terrabacter sp. BE26]|uniref:antibiotic biosynthesis monooxygenase n=1 Tax=Terrabacter sp. BE26 TaxID=2898152 RepID=UPI0035BE66B2